MVFLQLFILTMAKEMRREARYYEGLRFAERDVTLYCLEMQEEGSSLMIKKCASEQAVYLSVTSSSKEDFQILF